MNALILGSALGRTGSQVKLSENTRLEGSLTELMAENMRGLPKFSGLEVRRIFRFMMLGSRAIARF
jgi:hypothetical protein